jgi:hypothetical protein
MIPERTTYFGIGVKLARWKTEELRRPVALRA